MLPMVSTNWSADDAVTAPNSAALSYLTHVHHFERDQALRASRRAAGLVFVPTVALVAVACLLGLGWAARHLP